MKTTTPAIHRTARSLVRKHGEFADALAAIRHDELLEDGDVDGMNVWGRVVKAVRELQAEESGDGELSEQSR